MSQQVASPPLPPPPAPAETRFPLPIVLAVFAGLLIGILILVLVAVWINRPPAPEGCHDIVCPIGGRQAIHKVWNSDLGLSTEYPEQLTNLSSDPRILLISGNWSDTAGMTIRLEVAPADQVGSVQMLERQLDFVRQTVPTLDTDCVNISDTEWASACPVDVVERTVLGPAVGYVDGIGGMWGGTSQGGEQIQVMVLVAQRDGVTAAVVMSTNVPFLEGGHGGIWQQAAWIADDISNSIVWPGDQR